MVDHIEYISIREVLARAARHPMMQDLDLEAGVQYALDFFGKMGLPDVHVDKLAEVDIHDYRGELPCDVVCIHQVKNKKTDFAMRSMSDRFNTMSEGLNSEDTWKAKGRFIFTSFKEGKVIISYESLMTDEDGLPMLVDNAKFLNALELYIKVQKFTVLYDCGKIRPDILKNAKDDYAFAAGQCVNAFLVPSESEMQTITGMMHRMIPSRNEFKRGFKTLGDKEHYRRHQG